MSVSHLRSQKYTIKPVISPKPITSQTLFIDKIPFSEKRGRKRRGKSKKKKQKNGKKKSGEGRDEESQEEEDGGGNPGNGGSGCTQSDRTEFNAKVVEMIIGEFQRLRGGAPDGQQGTTTGQVGRSCACCYISYSLLYQSIVQVDITEYQSSNEAGSLKKLLLLILHQKHRQGQNQKQNLFCTSVVAEAPGIAVPSVVAGAPFIAEAPFIAGASVVTYCF